MLHLRYPLAATLLTILLTIGGTTAVGAADSPRLFLMDLSKGQLPAPYTDVDLASEVGRSLGAQGCRVEHSCRASDCLNERPAPAGVHLMTFEVSYDRRRYSCAVAVEVRDRAGGRVLYKENSSSPVCP